MYNPLAPVLPSDCQNCGVCCFSMLETFVQVTGNDYERLGDQADTIVHFVENRAYLRIVDGHCVALAADSTGRFRCTVYEGRPDACRNLERGSPGCAGEIATKGDRPRRWFVGHA